MKISKLGIKTSPRRLTTMIIPISLIFLSLMTVLLPNTLFSNILSEPLTNAEPMAVHPSMNTSFIPNIKKSESSKYEPTVSIQKTVSRTTTASSEANLTMQLAKSVFKKGEPITFTMTFQLPPNTVLNATVLLNIEPTSFLEAQIPRWPPILTITPITRELLNNPENSTRTVTISGQFGPFINDVNTQDMFALTVINNGYEPHEIPSWAKYRILSAKIINHTESGDVTVLEQAFDPPFDFEVQSLHEHALFTIVYADSEFWTDYGDPAHLLNESLHDSYQYQDRNITFAQEWNLRFYPLVQNWTTQDPLNLREELPRLLSLPKDTIGINGDWALRDGTALTNHGFDNIMGLSGKEHDGEMLGGLAYINSSALVTSGGWNYIIRYTYPRDVVRKVIMHEFIHNLGSGHVSESGWLMSSIIGGWKIHNATYKVIKENKDQFDGFIYKTNPNAPKLMVEANQSRHYTEQEILLSWNTNPKQLGGAITRYEIQWSSSPIFDNDVHVQEITRMQQYPLVMKDAGTYFIRVRAYNKWNQSSEWSNVLEVHVELNPNKTNSDNMPQISIILSFKNIHAMITLGITAMIVLNQRRRRKTNKRLKE